MAIKKTKKRKGYITLDQCVRDYCMNLGVGLERYEQFLKWAIDAYRKLKFDAIQEVKTVELPLTAWKAMEIPEDCVTWVMIGIRINGQVRVFTNHDGLALYYNDEDSDGFPDPQTLENDPVINSELVDEIPYYFNNINNNGEDTGQLYGLTIKDNGVGYYKINTERKEIQFNPSINANQKIYFEYITDALDPCGETSLPLIAAEYIEEYINWKRVKYSRAASAGDKREAKQDLKEAWYTVSDRILKIGVEEVLEAARNAYHLSPVM